jgi:TPR repeat protein
MACHVLQIRSKLCPDGRLRSCRGIAINLIDAAKYLKMSADQNHTNAQFTYGLCLAEGRGVEINLIDAAKYLKMSADQNHANAQFTYGLYFGEG